MKVKFLFDQGSAVFAEDRIIFQPPCFFGVIDGASGSYLPHEGPKLFDGRSGGQIASHFISVAFELARTEESLESILKRANNMLRKNNEESGLLLQEPEFLPEACFIVAKIDDRNITILQAPDCLAVWQRKNGIIGATSNPVYAYEKNLISIVGGLMKKHGGNRKKMWEEYRPILASQRRANTNTTEGYSVLNGQPEVEGLWKKFELNREEISLLILFSDGFVPFEWTENEKDMGERIIKLYQEDGFPSILKNTHRVVEEGKSTSHVDCPEASAIAIEF